MLVPMDHSPLARRALDPLEVHPSAAITVLHVVDYVEESYGAELLVGPEELESRAEERTEALTEALFESARALAATAGTPVTTVTRFGDPARTTVEYADTTDADLVVIGSHGRSLISRVLLGDPVDAVVHRAPMPVTVGR
ncbi:MAG: universal stress protein [Halobacteriales archaeon]